MDVNALLAQARNAPTPSPAKQAAPTSPRVGDEAPTATSASESNGATPPTEERASNVDAAAKAKGKATAKAEPTSIALKLGIVSIGFVLVATAGVLVAPAVVRERATTTAREAGFDVTIERVGIDFSGITLRGVTARARRAPGITATLPEVHVSGLSRHNARFFGLEVRAQGSASDLERELTTLVAQNRARFAGTATSPSHLSLVGARLVWEDGDRQRVSASDIGLEIDSRGNGVEDVRGNVGRFDITTKNANFGPWASSFERTPQGARLRVVFDPPVPDGPSALVVWTRAMPTEVTVKIPRSPFKNLGIRPVDVGLSASETTDVELELKGRLADEARSEITGRGAVWGLRPKGFATAIDVHVEGGATRLPGKPFELEKTSVTLGPFAAGVTGTVTPHDLGFRLDAMFRTAPIPCERIARAEAKNAGPLAAALQALGQSTGIIRVIGTVNASGVVKYDTAAPGDATLTWLAKETCGVSIFGK